MDYIEWFRHRITELRNQKGVSAREMSISLGQSESYINKIENKRTLPSLTGFIYICEYLDITPQEFFNIDASTPSKSNTEVTTSSNLEELLHEVEKLTPEQIERVLETVKDLTSQ